MITVYTEIVLELLVSVYCNLYQNALGNLLPKFWYSHFQIFGHGQYGLWALTLSKISGHW